MQKILFTLPFIAVLSACVSTQTASLETSTETPNTQQFSNGWTVNLKDHKAALRSCIIANKDIQSILYMDTKSDATVLTVKTKTGSVLDCSVNPTTNQVIKIEPRTENLPRNINQFYPVGKRLPDVCKGKISLRDEEDRLMGTVCY